MKEKSIIISIELIPAVLDGTKTQTRKVIKTFMHECPWGIAESIKDEDGLPCCVESGVENLCPYGQPGDRLWVRETWWTLLDNNSNQMLVSYKANLSTAQASQHTWKSPRFMPRWASRILLEITGVRAERLQEINEIDAIKEGAAYFKTEQIYGHAPTQVFHAGWDSFNARLGYGWDINPWVWVIEFRRINEEPLEVSG